ncbi:hypothetical protein MNBD_BACTEROID01-2488 [hydrothermal vent metagenome]|uniref:Uncharacterized protein n=1 Tax=hydrothermal vent metagenome TaxID=652676 RepID=A0A3B0TXM8_9ZZZZ
MASNCKAIISITSAGILKGPIDNPQYILITEAIRDEGTSYLFCSFN